MCKREQGAIYSCSSGKSTPRAVERTTWLGRGPTGCGNWQGLLLVKTKVGRGTGLRGCSFASNYGWIREVWVRGDGTGATRCSDSQARKNPSGDAGGGPLMWGSWWGYKATMQRAVPPGTDAPQHQRKDSRGAQPPKIDFNGMQLDDRDHPPDFAGWSIYSQPIH
jgi:hypothetical protein